jgi:hypothetical protein
MEPTGAWPRNVVDANSLKNMVGLCGLEPQTSTVSIPNVRAIAANFVAKEMSTKLWKVALIRLANIVFSVDCGTVQVRRGFSLREFLSAIEKVAAIATLTHYEGAVVLHDSLCRNQKQIDDSACAVPSRRGDVKRNMASCGDQGRPSQLSTSTRFLLSL